VKTELVKIENRSSIIEFPSVSLYERLMRGSLAEDKPAALVARIRAETVTVCQACHPIRVSEVLGAHRNTSRVMDSLIQDYLLCRFSPFYASWFMVLMFIWINEEELEGGTATMARRIEFLSILLTF
jgi:hypothetical protein